MGLRADHLHDPYLVGNGACCSSCCPDGPPEDVDQSRFRRGCNECGGRGRVPFSAETIVRLTRGGGMQPDPPIVPHRPSPARGVERVRPVLRRRPV